MAGSGTTNRPDSRLGSAAGAAPAAGEAATTAGAGAGGPGISKPAGSSPSNATWTWSWCAPSVKNSGGSRSHGEPTSVGRMAPSSSAIAETSSRAAPLPGETGSPSTRAMSRPRPTKWFDTEPPEVNWS